MAFSPMAVLFCHGYTVRCERKTIEKPLKTEKNLEKIARTLKALIFYKTQKT
jgi:hypothetical protein